MLISHYFRAANVTQEIHIFLKLCILRFLHRVQSYNSFSIILLELEHMEFLLISLDSLHHIQGPGPSRAHKYNFYD